MWVASMKEHEMQMRYNEKAKLAKDKERVNG